MKIITAINNQKIYIQLKNEIENNIVNPDIQYQEGIFEVVENIGRVNLIILNEKLSGKMNFEDFINLLIEKKCAKKYIIILQKKNIKKVEFLYSKGINNIFYNNKFLISNLLKIINNKNINNKKKYGTKIIINKILKKILRIKIKILKILNIKINNKKIAKNKIITFLGNEKVGKTIILIIFSLILKNKKILLIDFNYKNNDLKNIYFLKKYKYKKYNKKIKVNKNIDFIYYKKNDLNENKIKEILNNNIKKYKYIFIDTLSSDFSEHIKSIINISDINLLIIEPNFLELKKTRILLNNYINIWKIKKEKIYIIFNKINNYSIDDYLLNNLFYDFKILGKIKYRKTYNLIINSELKIIPNIIKKEYKKIINKI